MLLQLQNDCEDQRTLDLYNKFIYSPHCLTGVIYPIYDDEGIIGEEVVEITFTHYVEVITVVFKASKGVGEVFLHAMDTIGNSVDESGGSGSSGGEGVTQDVTNPLTEEDFTESLMYCGLITEDKLAELLESLPHIRNFMEAEVGDGVLH